MRRWGAALAFGGDGGRLKFEDDAGEVHVIPGLGDLAVCDVQEAGSGEGGGTAGGRKSQGLTRVGDGGGPAGGYIISFGDGLVDMDLDVGEGIFEERVSLREFGGAGEDGGGLGKAVGYAIGMEEFMDGGGTALIPNFVEPALDELLVGVAHGSLLARKEKE